MGVTIGRCKFEMHEQSAHLRLSCPINLLRSRVALAVREIFKKGEGKWSILGVHWRMLVAHIHPLWSSPRILPYNLTIFQKNKMKAVLYCLRNLPVFWCFDFDKSDGLFMGMKESFYFYILYGFLKFCLTLKRYCCKNCRPKSKHKSGVYIIIFYLAQSM